MTQDEAKLLVAKRAVELVHSEMHVGLGTGTTASLFIRELGKRVQQGLKIRCVASSEASQRLAEELGIEVRTLADLPELDIYIDGADEIARVADSGLALIKGGGGALLREKIVASAARQFVVVVDETKVVERLGRFPLPIEVIKMAAPVIEPRLERIGLQPKLRQKKDGSGPFLTDENNYIFDCECGVIDDPARTAAEIRGIVGVVEHGLFLGMASLALVAGERGVAEMKP